MDTKINFPKARIVEFCRKNHITRMALLGDAVPDYYPGATRVKVLVQFDPEHIPGLAFFRMQRELGKIIGHSVDLHSPGGMRSDFWPQALAEAQEIYATAR